MTPAKDCKHCGELIRWVGGFRRPMDAEGAYFMVEADGPETAYTDRGDFHRGRFGKLIGGKPWVIGYRPHACAAREETAKGSPHA